MENKLILLTDLEMNFIVQMLSAIPMKEAESILRLKIRNKFGLIDLDNIFSPDKQNDLENKHKS